MQDPREPSKIMTSKLCYYCQVQFPTTSIMHKHVMAKHPGSDADRAIKLGLGLSTLPS